MQVKAEIVAKRKELEKLREFRRSRTRPDNSRNVGDSTENQVTEFITRKIKAEEKSIGQKNIFEPSPLANMSDGIEQLGTNVKELEFYTKTVQTTTCDIENPSSHASKDSAIKTQETEIQFEALKPQTPPVQFQFVENLTDSLNEPEFNQRLMRFIDYSFPLVEKALFRHSDICISYDEESAVKSCEDVVPFSISYRSTIKTNEICKNRSITWVTHSLNHPELVLSAYSLCDDISSTDPDGLVLIQNTLYSHAVDETALVRSLTCQTLVTSCQVSPFNPYLVFGSTISGQMVCWDLRINKRIPSQTSASNIGDAEVHNGALRAFDFVGTENSHNIVSVGTDGKMCTWTVEMLSKPVESSNLAHKHARSIPTTCMDFFTGNSTNYVIGCEDGKLYAGKRLGNSRLQIFNDVHSAPVTAVTANPCVSEDSLANLFLSSSMDWKVKLWDLKLSNPLHTFEFLDCVYDVKWNPQLPNIFSAVDGLGKLFLFDLSLDFETPIFEIDLLASHDCVGSCLSWSPSGSELIVGTFEGSHLIFSVRWATDFASNAIPEFTHKLSELSAYQSNNTGEL